MANINYAPRYVSGEFVSTVEVVKANGTVAQVTVEKFEKGFMFIIEGATNYRLYATAQKAINAAGKLG